MPIIILIAALIVLRYFEIWKFAEMSWWYVVLAMVVAFIYFEFIEKLLGLDKTKDQKLEEQRRKERLKNTFNKKK